MKLLIAIFFGISLLWPTAPAVPVPPAPSPTAGAVFVPPAKTHFKLFLLIGQSNMAGRGAMEARDRVANPRVVTLDAMNNWVPAIDPLHFDKPAIVGVGPGKTFGERIAVDFPNDVIGLIPCAVGGTSIDDWLNENPGLFYDQAVQRTRRAMQDGTLVGIIWHQGESDVNAAATYLPKLVTFFAKLRKALGAAKVPVIVGTLGPFIPNREGVNAAIRQLPWKVPLCGVIESAGLKSVGDNLHFDTPSYRSLGLRYAGKWLVLAKPK